MYESFFEFRERPFAAAPITNRYFAGLAIEAARQAVMRCIERAEGAAIVVGPTGSGKTLLCQVLAEQFRGRLEIAQLTSGRLGNRRSLLQAILFELGLPFRGLDEGDLRLSLIDHLSPRGKDEAKISEGLLLIVDEAHTLPLRLMEELRLITNLAKNGQPRVRLVLVGSPQLEERFASPKLQSLNQRIAVRGYLEPLDRTQTIEYVKHQIELVGGQLNNVFTDDALSAIYRATDGIPRLINQVCDHALLLAYAGGVRPISANGIEEAWADLQQLPTPWSSSAGDAASSSADIIEFGQLDSDAAEDLPAAVPFPAARRTPPREEVSDTEFENAVEFAAADDEFQPAGSIHPEVELTFQSLSTPFHSFDEEEVVIDRYTSIERDALANRPLVRAPESRELSAMLSPTSHFPAVRTMTHVLWPGGTPGDGATATGEAVARQDDELSGQTFDAGPADDRGDSEKPREVAGSAFEEEAHEPVKSSAAAVESLASTDDDLIVIEEPTDQTATPGTPKPVVRRQEYRQLFAQLRRG